MAKVQRKKKISSDESATVQEIRDFLGSLSKDFGGTIAADGPLIGDVPFWISTGSYIFNAQISGSMYRGIPGNRIMILAGKEATGKTYFALGIVKHFQDTHPNAFVVLFESESEVSNEMLENHKIDRKRVLVVPVSTVEAFRLKALELVNKAIANRKGKKPMSFMFVLDSLGSLVTDKLVEDTEALKTTKDMTRPGKVKETLQLLVLKLGEIQAPLLCTNWLYVAPPIKPATHATLEMHGGSGPKYVASTVIYLTKQKRTNAAKEVTGQVITATAKKARFAIADSKVVTLLDYDSGLNPYFGLLEFGLERKIFKQNDKKRIELPNGKSAFASVIYRDPETYFTEDVMAVLEETCQKYFPYKNSQGVVAEATDDLEETPEFDVAEEVQAEEEDVA